MWQTCVFWNLLRLFKFPEPRALAVGLWRCCKISFVSAWFVYIWVLLCAPCNGPVFLWQWISIIRLQIIKTDVIRFASISLSLTLIYFPIIWCTGILFSIGDGNRSLFENDNSCFLSKEFYVSSDFSCVKKLNATCMKFLGTLCLSRLCLLRYLAYLALLYLCQTRQTFWV